jgi:hypothetical protein
MRRSTGRAASWPFSRQATGAISTYLEFQAQGQPLAAYLDFAPKSVLRRSQISYG